MLGTSNWNHWEAAFGYQVENKPTEKTDGINLVRVLEEELGDIANPERE